MPWHQDHAGSEVWFVKGNQHCFVSACQTMLRLTWNKVPLHHLLVCPPSFMNFGWIGLCCRVMKKKHLLVQLDIRTLTQMQKCGPAAFTHNSFFFHSSCNLTQLNSGHSGVCSLHESPDVKSCNRFSLTGKSMAHGYWVRCPSWHKNS